MNKRVEKTKYRAKKRATNTAKTIKRKSKRATKERDLQIRRNDECR